MLDMRGLRKAVLFRLFDALIGPVVSYGSQVWMPSTHAFDQIIIALHEPNQSTAATHSYLPKIATDPIERLHLPSSNGLWESANTLRTQPSGVTRVAIP